MYADVQWLGASDQEEREEEQQWMMLNGKMDRDEEEVNKKKILAIVNEYKNFKKRSVKHYRFNAEATPNSFGEF